MWYTQLGKFGIFVILTTTAVSASSSTQIPVQHVGPFTVKYPSAFVLNKAESKSVMSTVPANLVRSLSVYNSKPYCGIAEARLAAITYNSDFQIDIDGAAEGSTDQISTLEGITSQIRYITPKVVSGLPARHVTYTTKRWGDMLGAEFLLVADKRTNTLWQLQLLFAAKNTSNFSKLKSTRACAKSVIAGVSFNSSH